MASEKKLQRLKLDLEALFPGESLTIAGCTVEIVPLGLIQLSSLTRKLKGFGTHLAEEGITWDNYSSPENLLKLAGVLLEQAPDVLEEASNIAAEDIKMLPMDQVVLILDKVIEVNLKSKATLEGNFKSLMGRFNPAKLEKNSKSQRPSKG